MKSFSQFAEETGKVSSITQHHHDMLKHTGLSPDIRSSYEKSLPHHEKLDKMTPEKHIEKMEKTRKSIQNHVASGGNSHGQRGSELRSRYDDHADRMKELHPAHWKAHNERNRTDRHHTGHDLFA
jgi:hypothetical protein